MNALDLRGLIREVADGSSLRGPREIAAKVAENIPAGKVRAALAEALVAYVREELTRARQVRPVSPAAPANSGRSSKVAAIREAWRKVLVGQYPVGGGGWKRLADCSYEAVLFIANERREQAARNEAAAAVFSRLAAAMRKHNAAVVSDLPDVVLADILSAEAAKS